MFCYTVMSFGLKNAGATYQRTMQACLLEQIGRNIYVYVEDIVVTTRNRSLLLDDLRETFANLNKFQIKLNPLKCTFGVPAGQLLGYLICARGIEANPEKIEVIMKMEKPRNLKGIQRLTRRLAALGRFVARLGEKALPFYQLLKNGDNFEWNDEAQRAFDDL